MNISKSKNMKLGQTMREAIEYRNQDCSQKAVTLLLPHVRLIMQSAPAAGLLATLYWDQHNYAKAAKWFAVAVRLAPLSEKASLGLFHSLWEIGKRDQAFDEMRRFLIIGESTEYRRLLRDLKGELALDNVAPSKLPIAERFSMNAAERAGLDWRRFNHLTPLTSLELQHA